MNKKITVAQVAERYGVTKQAVYNWLAEGLPCEVERISGRKTRKMILEKDVVKFLDLPNVK